ncbi:MAG TPA: hypothetical protein VN039_11490, partial [Nitrospira sp.]|nr:hypothetical protein [Nitrospira sp.]
GGYSFTVGLKGYFGGTDDGKSLIDRQRQDDPPNRAIDLFTAAGNQLYQTAPPSTDNPSNYNDEESCVAHGYVWNDWDSENEYCAATWEEPSG